MNTILVAVDLSPPSAQVIAAAAQFAKQLDAKVIVLHVVSAVNACVPIGSSMDVAIIPKPPSQEEIEEIKQQLDQVAAPLKLVDLQVETILEIGLPVEEIEKKSSAVSLIIVGSHGHGGLYHLFNGSVVNALLKKGEKPILVIPVH